MWRLRLVLLVLVALVLAACGGGGEGSNDVSSASPTPSSTMADTDSDSAAEDEDSTDGQDATDVTVGDIGDHLDTAGGTALVSIGDESWQFELSEEIPIASCDADFFGGFVAILTSVDATMSSPFDTVRVQLPGGDFTDAPVVEVNLGIDDDLKWTADETIYERTPDLPAGLGVTGFSIDGNTASGTAVFYEQESYHQFNAGNADALLVAEGTFEVSCVSE